MLPYRSIADLNRAIIANLHKVPRDIDLVVGIPRSGMLAANILALHLNLPFTDLEGFACGRLIATGRRIGQSLRREQLSCLKKALVIDDTLLTGLEMTRAKEFLKNKHIPSKIVFAAVYIYPPKEKLVDIYFEPLPYHRVFEWNIMHHSILTDSCVDIDGVIAKDPLLTEDDDGANYQNFLRNGSPFYIPTITVGWLVTCRLEKYRSQTEEWLHKHGVKYRELIMLNMPDKESRMKSGAHAAFKAAAYQSTGAKLFIESSYHQAHEIALLAKRPVYCFETREMIYPVRDPVAMEEMRRLSRLAYNKARFVIRDVQSRLHRRNT